LGAAEKSNYFLSDFFESLPLFEELSFFPPPDFDDEDLDFFAMFALLAMTTVNAPSSASFRNRTNRM